MQDLPGNGGVSHSGVGVWGGARAHPVGATGGRLGASRQPQVLSQCGATAIIMLVGDTYTLINYVSFINYLCYGVTILGLLLLRWRRPALHRPIKVRPWDGWPPCWVLPEPPLYPQWAPEAGGMGGASFCGVLGPAQGSLCTEASTPHSSPMRTEL